MGSAERRAREKQAVQTTILDAARAIMSERGFEGLTMRAVADRAEYTAAAIYKHFADRESLVRELCANDFYAFAQVFRPAVTTDMDPLDRLRGIGRTYVEFAMGHPEQYRVMFMTPSPVEDAYHRGDPERDAYMIVETAVAAAQEAGHFTGLDPHTVAQTMWASMHGVVSLEIAHLPMKKRHLPFASLKARVEMALESVILGLAALAAQPPKKPAARRRTSRR